MKLRHVLFGVIIAIIALYFTFKDVSLSEILHSIVRLQYQYLPAAFVIFVAGFVLRAYRWHFLCRSVKDIPTSRLYSPMMIGFMGNLLPLRAGEFIRAYLLGKREQISFSASFATIVVERVLDVFLILISFAGLLVIHPEVFVPKGSEQMRVATYIRSFGTMSVVASIGLVVFFYLLIHQQAGVQRFVRIFTQVLPQKVQFRIEEILNAFIQGLGILKDPRGILVTIILSGLLWITIIVVNYPLYYCYNIHDKLPFSSLVTMIVVTCVLIAVMPTPGYLGPFQFAITYVLADLYGIDRSIAASFSLVTWFLQMAMVFLAGLFFLIKDNISFLEISRKAREEAHEVSSHGVGGMMDKSVPPENQG